MRWHMRGVENGWPNLDKRKPATAALDTALAIQPENLEWLRFLAELLNAQARFHEAEQIYRRVLKIEPANAVHLNDLGLILADQGCMAEALSAYEAALNVRSEFSIAAFQSIADLVATRPAG